MLTKVTKGRVIAPAIFAGGYGRHHLPTDTIFPLSTSSEFVGGVRCRARQRHSWIGEVGRRSKPVGADDITGQGKRHRIRPAAGASEDDSQQAKRRDKFASPLRRTRVWFRPPSMNNSSAFTVTAVCSSRLISVGLVFTPVVVRANL